MSYTNTTKDTIPLVYPISMPVKWVDDTIDFRSTSYRVSPEAGASERHGQGVATVRVAHELTEADRDRLAAALQRQYDRPVHLNVLVDPEVLGGIRVEIGDDVIDGTVAARLADARRLLAG